MSPVQGGPKHPVVTEPALSRFLQVPKGLVLTGLEDESMGPTFPAGIVASGIVAGLKESGRPDMGVVAIAKEYWEGSVSAAMLTQNAFAAAPIVVDRSACDLGGLKAVVANSGNANACTGVEGLKVAKATQEAAATALDLPTHSVAVTSTGVIGVCPDAVRLPSAARQACVSLEDKGGSAFARSIMTTDRFAKACTGSVATPTGMVNIGACAKGAGMISPAMATMLCFVTTDAELTRQQADSLLRRSVEQSFNKVTVDGEMSTNDSVFFLASGASNVRPDAESLEIMSAALEWLLLRLALMMVADGEGATKIMRLRVKGAQTAEMATRVARAVADSPLVKTAMHGCDPNWGRVMSSAGAALAGRELPHASLQLCGVTVVENAAVRRLSGSENFKLGVAMKDSEIELELGLGIGDSSAEIFFADMGHEYITINAEYHS